MPSNPANEHDRWGDSILESRQTYTLATLFRLMTLAAALIGWLVVVVNSGTFTPVPVCGAALLIACIAAYRQRGGITNRLAVFLAFSVGTAFVGGLIPALLQVLAKEHLALPRVAGRFDAQVALCLLLPAVAAVSYCLLQCWVVIADEDDRQIRRI